MVLYCFKTTFFQKVNTKSCLDDIYTYIDKLTIVDTQIESLHDPDATDGQDLENSTNIKLDRVCAIDI